MRRVARPAGVVLRPGVVPGLGVVLRPGVVARAGVVLGLRLSPGGRGGEAGQHQGGEGGGSETAQKHRNTCRGWLDGTR